MAKYKKADGSSATDQETYTRVGMGSGFGGTWVGKIHPGQPGLNLGPTPPDWVIEPYDGDGLSFVNLQASTPNEKDIISMEFDGKDYSESVPAAHRHWGYNVPCCYKANGRRQDGHTLEVNYKIGEQTAYRQKFVLSPDSKTMTVTVSFAPPQKQLTVIYDKQ